MPAPDIYAFSSKKKARKFALKKYGVELKPWSTNGLTTTLVNGDETVCIVVVSTDRGPKHKAALLAHECVHVAHSWADAMGDEHPSEEFMAYSAQCAFLACIDQLGDEWLA